MRSFAAVDVGTTLSVRLHYITLWPMCTLSKDVRVFYFVYVTSWTYSFDNSTSYHSYVDVGLCGTEGPERSTGLYCWDGVLQPRLRAGTGPFAAIFCPTKQPSQEGNQPGLHCRFVPGSGQWLLTDFSLARMEMSVSVWFFYLLSGWMRAAHQEVSSGWKFKNDY